MVHAPSASTSSQCEAWCPEPAAAWQSPKAATGLMGQFDGAREHAAPSLQETRVSGLDREAGLTFWFHSCENYGVMNRTIGILDG